MTLSADDQEMVKTSIKATKRKISDKNGTDEPDSKKQKVDDEKQQKEKEAIKKQMKKIFYYRDLLERNLKKNEMQDLLESNKQEIPNPASLENILDRLADCMTFGALERCQECPGGGQFVFR